MGEPTFSSNFVATPQVGDPAPVVVETSQPDPKTPLITTKPKHGMGLKEEDPIEERGTGALEENPSEQAPRRKEEPSKFVDAHRIAAILSKHNITDIDPNLLNIKDLKEASKGLMIKLDNGHELQMGTFPNGAPFIAGHVDGPLGHKDAAAIIALGKSAGWGKESICVNGNDRDKTMLIIEAEKQGVKVMNPPPQDVFAKYKQEIEAEDKSPAKVANATVDAGAKGGAPVRQAPRQAGPKM